MHPFTPPAAAPVTTWMCRLAAASLLALECAAPVGFAAAPASAVQPPDSQLPDYQQDVQPILAEHCGHCHGVDDQSRKGDLRLDIRQNALEGGESGQPAIVPGRPDESEMVSRILSDDPDTIMPPPHEKKPVSAAQIKTLKDWIASGARYDPHWAFVPPQRPALPAAAAATPIDAIVASHLAAKGLAPAPAADAAALCRRVYLDLVGLPPSPEQLAAFEAEGYEKTVDALLASERYGEKWARHWLDLARYSDTNGYEKDFRREMWAWRDWVIAALNRDMPYDQFVVEQVAGDLLSDATQEQIVATGFLRNSMLNEEGAIIPEEFRMVEMFDRMDCVGKAVLGLTTQCAQCHTHKFDPLTHDEYYGLFAFVNNTYESRSYVYTPGQRAAIDDLRRQLAAADEKVRAQRPAWQQEMAAWEARVAAGLVAWTPVEMTEMSSSSLLTHPTQLPDRSILMLGHWDKEMIFESRPDLRGATGLQLEALTHGDLFMQGPGRDGAWGVEELKCFVKKPGEEKWEPLPLVNATADFSKAERIETKPAPKDGKEPEKEPEKKIEHGPVAKLVDGDDATAWETDRGHIVRHQPSVAVAQFEKPLDLPEGTEFKVVVRMAGSDNMRMLACCRVSLTTAPAPAAPPIDHGAVLAIRTPKERRPPADEAAIFAAWRKSVADLAPVNAEIAALWEQMPQAPTTVLHLAERPHTQHRKTHLLDRGTWDQPLREIGPHVPAALHPFPADAPRNRLGFARWLVDPRSPLTSRVAVNRIWQTLFGAGLVETSDDFGTRSPVPEYRDLLDWLAVDFVEHGWSQKHLIRQVVMSATYRQSSRATPETLARDPGNRLLARGPRFRVEAEVVRDIALAVSGLLTQKMGGPGVIPPVPQNVLDYNFNYPDYWKPAEGPERYRRSVYLFRKRSMPDPVMASFDAPNGDLSCARRLRSNTPLAALAGLNEPVFVEAARALALRTLREGGSDDSSRGHHAFLLCTSRPPTADELQELLAFVGAQRKRLADGWVDARELATGDGGKLPALPEHATPQDAAAWTLAARVLLNLDETITKN